MRETLFLLLISLSLSTSLDYTVTLSELPEGEWSKITATGFVEPNPVCSDNSTYSFMYFKNSSNPNLIIFFQGGGGCGSVVSCAAPVFLRNNLGLALLTPNQVSGFQYVEELKGRSILYVSYCTGDLHIGDLRRDMSSLSLPDVLQYGYRNAKSAVDWIVERWDTPEKLLVAGCSAGGYGSIYWTPYIHDAMNAGKISQWSDSAVGANIFLPSLSWGTTFSSVNTIYGGLNAPNNMLSDLYSQTAAAYPQIQFSQFTHVQDSVQIDFAGGISNQDFEGLVQTFFEAPTESNYHYYAATGDEHCVVSMEWDSYSMNDVRLIDFMASIGRVESPHSVGPWVQTPGTTELSQTMTSTDTFVETNTESLEISETKDTFVETNTETPDISETGPQDTDSSNEEETIAENLSSLENMLLITTLALPLF